MKFKILILAVLTALIGTDASAAISPSLSGPAGYMNVFSLGISGGKDAYLFGTSYTVADLQAITTNDIAFELLPNTLAYADAVASGLTNEIDYWTDSTDGGVTPGSDGNKWIEASTYYETTSIPAGTTNVTFNFTTGANTLDPRYQTFTQEPRAFLKVFNPGYGSLFYEAYAILAGSTSGSLSFDIPVGAWGYPLQCGFVLEGKNAASDIWGSIEVNFDDVILTSGDFTPPAPAPTFFAGPTALSDSSITMTSTTATDPAGVEYLFTNSTLGYTSGWLADTNWIDLGPLGPSTTGDVEVAAAPDFVPLDGVWEGWDGGGVAPSSFVVVNTGVATVTPASAGERSFYQSHGAGSIPALAPNQAYEFSFSSDNVSAAGVEAFVKAFSSGWGEDLGQQQLLALTGGGATQTISFTTDGGASAYYQIGFRTIGATTGSYDVSGISLLALDLVQEGPPLGLTPSTPYDYQVKARDLSTLTNETAWSAISSATTLAGDTNAPSPDPMTFVGPGEGSPQSVKMTATTATDASAVEYYFESVSGDGADSGWQSSPIYIDTGLASSSNFQYRVRARDLSLSTNTTAWSVTNVSITTLPYPLSVSLTNDLKGFTGNSNLDATVHEILKANLQFEDYADLNRRVAFDASGATFGSFASGDNGRNVLKTLASDYASADFVAYISSSFSAIDQNTFIGIGPGDLGAFGVPDWAPNGETTNASFIVQVLETGLEVWSQTNNFGGANYATTSNAVLALVTGTVQRIKLDYDAGAETCIVSVDTTYDGVTFTPDVTLGPIATPEFTGATTVYLGGDDDVILSDFEIIGGSAPVIGVTDLTISASGQLQWSSVSGQNYDVVYKNNLVTEPTWTPDAANQNIPGTGGVLSATPSIAGDEVFYQVIAE